MDENKLETKKNWGVEAMKLVLWLGATVLIAFVINFFFFSVGQVHDISMQPTLYEGDRVLVDKITYTFANPDRFDVVIVDPSKTSEMTDKLLIKRVVGLPGEKVAFKDNQLYINDELMAEDFIINPELQYTNDFNLADMPNNSGAQTIPNGYYLVVGDNRSHSLDSRQLGLIPKEQFIGKARFVFWPFGDWQWL